MMDDADESHEDRGDDDDHDDVADYDVDVGDVDDGDDDARQELGQELANCMLRIPSGRY